MYILSTLKCTFYLEKCVACIKEDAYPLGSVIREQVKIMDASL